MGVGRHTVYNLAGSIAPMFVSVVTVPIYLHLVGDTRYGVLSIVWLFLGYFGLFDPGLSRAATYHIARLHDASAKERGDVFWTAVVVNVAFGLIGGLVLYLVARPLFLHAFKMPTAMRGEVLACLPWLALSIPVSIVSGVLASVLQARERFGVLNTINVFSTIITQTGPLAIVHFHGPSLVWLIPAILVARAMGAVPMFIAVARALPLGEGGHFQRGLLPSLFSYGGWITVTNLAAPILTTMDRMVIGSVLSAEAVAFYTVPFNLVTRVSVIPGALSSSLFPKLSRNSNAESGRLASDAVMTLAAVMTPLAVTGIVCLPVFMRLWVGETFAANATVVGMIFLFGVWINGLGYIPSGLLQASNRPDLTAKYHVCELVPFLVVLWFGVQCFGLIGAACAWTLRVTADTVLLFFGAGQLRVWTKLLPGIAIIMAAPFCAPRALVSYQSLLGVALVCCAAFWGWKVSPQVRQMAGKQFGRLLMLRPA